MSAIIIMNWTILTARIAEEKRWKVNSSQIEKRKLNFVKRNWNPTKNQILTEHRQPKSQSGQHFHCANAFLIRPDQFSSIEFFLFCFISTFFSSTSFFFVIVWCVCDPRLEFPDFGQISCAHQGLCWIKIHLKELLCFWAFVCERPKQQTTPLPEKINPLNEPNRRFADNWIGGNTQKENNSLKSSRPQTETEQIGRRRPSNVKTCRHQAVRPYVHWRWNTKASKRNLSRDSVWNCSMKVISSNGKWPSSGLQTPSTKAAISK